MQTQRLGARRVSRAGRRHCTFYPAVCLALAAILTGCVSSGVPNAAGLAPVQVDPSVPGPVNGVGIEGHDIVSMTDQMMRDILSEPALAGRTVPPRVVIDSNYFRNTGSQAINRDLITNRLRVNLNRAAKGRLVFLTRTDLSMVQQEQDLKAQGTVDAGTLGNGQMLGADYRLRGEIATADAKSTKTGLMQRYNQITFEMIDLERGTIVWSGIYEFARAAADDIIYR
jgi:penicillin-binding protein activator